MLLTAILTLSPFQAIAGLIIVALLCAITWALAIDEGRAQGRRDERARAAEERIEQTQSHVTRGLRVVGGSHE